MVGGWIQGQTLLGKYCTGTGLSFTANSVHPVLCSLQDAENKRCQKLVASCTSQKSSFRWETNCGAFLVPYGEATTLDLQFLASFWILWRDFLGEEQKSPRKGKKK